MATPTSRARPRALSSPALRSGRLSDRHLQALLAVTALAAAVRFATLATQSYWIDEAVTVHLVRDHTLRGMLSAIPSSESTPPLYYVLAWGWAQLFGAGEAGLRSLSALLGVATVPLAYLAAARLVSRRAGLVVAALAAVNPLLVWYSQEARAYALLVLLTTAGLVFFARALERPSRPALAGWAIASAAALASHYFAVFVILPEAVWLLARRRGRGELAAVGAVVAAGAALLPLAIHQSSNHGADFIKRISLAKRVAQVPKQYLVGFDSPLEAAVTAVALALAAYGIWLLLTRGDARDRRGAVRAATIAVPALALPLVLALARVDYLITRNVIESWVPAAVVPAAGFGAVRARTLGAAGAAALCALSLAVVIGVNANHTYQRGDWRGLGHALGPAPGPRAIVLSPAGGNQALSLYSKPFTSFPAGAAAVVEIDAVAVAERQRGQTPTPPPVHAAPAPAGFAVAGERATDTYTLVRYRAPRPTPVGTPELEPLRLSPEEPDLLLQQP